MSLLFEHLKRSKRCQRHSRSAARNVGGGKDELIIFLNELGIAHISVVRLVHCAGWRIDLRNWIVICWIRHCDMSSSVIDQDRVR